MFSYPNLWVMMLGVFTAMFFIVGCVHYVNKLFINDILADVNLQYKKINSDSIIQLKMSINNTIPINIDSANLHLRLAAAICMYGSLLKKSKHAKGFDFIDIADLIIPVVQKDNYLHQEFLGLLQKTESIYHLNKKRKKKNSKIK